MSFVQSKYKPLIYIARDEYKKEVAMAEKKPTRQAYEILRDAMLKVKFHHPMLDRKLDLIPQARQWIKKLIFEYYYAQKVKHPGFASKIRFMWVFHRRSEDFPLPILADELLPQHQVQAVPGGYLESNGFLGYFKPTTDPNGRFFIAPNGDRIEPILYELKEIKQSLRELIDQSAGDKERQQMLILHYKDVSLNTEIAEFIPKVRSYAAQHHLPGLKTGHLVLWVSGMTKYCEELKEEITEMGFAVYQMDGKEPLMKLLLDLHSKLESAVLNFTLDLFLPLLESVRMECKLKKGKIKCTRSQYIRRSWLSEPLDWILSFFHKKKPEKVEQNLPEKKKETVIEPKVPIKPKPKPYIKEIRSFVDLHTALEKFVESIREDLAPEVNEKGEVTDYRAMFDQFDLSDEDRDLGYTRFILEGKLNGIDPMDFRYKDQTIVNSTHWIYDRIQEILGRFDFPTTESLTREDAFRFMEEVRLLFYPSRHETMEKRKYGTFVQFRINLRRLFLSNTTHSRYHALINQISTFLDKCREQYEKEGKK